MDTPIAGVSYQTFTDEELLYLLASEEDRLTRAAVDEFVARGDRMIEPLTRILQAEEEWFEEGSAFWRPVHAAFILGAIGGEKSIPGLLAALPFALDSENDWVLNELPWMFAAIGPAALQPLFDRSREKGRDVHERLCLFEALTAIAELHPERRNEYLTFLRGIIDDAAESWDVRIAAGNEILSFALPEDYDALVGLAKKAERNPYPLFNQGSVKDAYEGKFRPSGKLPFHWLDFYSPGEIEERKQRWRREDSEEPVEPDASDFMEDEEPAEEIDDAPPPLRAAAAVGRNDPCPCGSGKKFKKCCEK